MTSTSSGALLTVSTASSPKRASTPASKAAATAKGMRSIRRSNQPVRPKIRINTAQNRNAPTASGMLRPEVAASKAAPGVDQAVKMGWRDHQDRPRLVSPMPRPRAHIQELVWAGVAPSACAA